MSNSINGNIIVIGKVPEYNNKLTNDIVAETIKPFGVENKKYEKDCGLTHYARKFTNANWRGVLRKTPWKAEIENPCSYRGETQPFIYVLDEATNFFEWADSGDLRILPLRKDLSLIVRVSSGSHVGISDTLAAQEIYDVTMALYELLTKRKQEVVPRKRKLEVLFDDEHHVFTPKHFSEDISFYQR